MLVGEHLNLFKFVKSEHQNTKPVQPTPKLEISIKISKEYIYLLHAV